MVRNKTSVLVVLLVSLLLLPLIAPAMVRGVIYFVPVSVTVKPAYKLALDIKILNDKVFPGEDLEVLLKLRKNGGKEEIEVGLDYEIKKKKETISSGFIGTLNVSKKVEDTAHINLPNDIKKGKYELFVTASHPQADPDTDKAKFSVEKGPGGKDSAIMDSSLNDSGIVECALWEFWCWLW